MSNRAPDFSSTFEIVDDQLQDAERRLNARRAESKEPRIQNPSAVPGNSASKTAKVNESSDAESPKPKPVRKARPKGEAPKPGLVKRAVRRNLTLKVLEENEIKFNQLFHGLQLAGDHRKKQDLADEAIRLLLEKYSRFRN